MQLKTDKQEAHVLQYVKFRCDQRDYATLLDEDDFQSYSLDDILKQIINYDERLIADYTCIWRDSIQFYSEWEAIKKLRNR